MKKNSLVILILIFFFLISCANSAKKKSGEIKPIDETANQANELAEKAEEPPVDEKIEAEELAADDTEEQPDAETAQAVSDEESEDEKVTLETEPAEVQEVAVTPPAQTPPAQPPVQAQPQTPPQQPQAPVQPPRQTPPVQQPQTPTQPSRQTPPAQPQVQPPQAQPPAEEKKADDSASSDSDAETKKETPPSMTSGNPPPATRIESWLQMGTMPHDNEIVFSRIVRATVGQMLEIPFRGNGWVFLGELTSQRGIVYSSRRNDSDGQTFIFTLEEAGTYVLKFYRQDFIRDYILNDHVQVIVGEAPTAGAGWFNPPVDRGRVTAQPRWPPSAVEETRIASGAKPSSEPVVTNGVTTETAKETTQAINATPQQRQTTERETTPPRTTTTQETNTAKTSVTPTNVNPSAAPSTQSGQASAPIAQTQTPSGAAIGQGSAENSPAEKREVLAPEVVMQKAKENFDGGNISTAIALLEQFMADYPGGSDEVYWQLGQYYEANSPSRNILLSLDYYRRLINEYPQSKRFNDARRRIAYLERYYINIQ